MNKLLISLFAPLLMATQCDEGVDPLFATELFIQNDSSVDLTYLMQDATEVVIESNLLKPIAYNTNTTESSVLPSESDTFDSSTLFKEEASGSMVRAYQQDLINNELWELNESGSFDFEYSLIIIDLLSLN
jgi:hypothetical protein